jgi:hypothetical protein
MRYALAFFLMATISAASPAATTAPAEYSAHVESLRGRLPAAFHMVIQPPFVVISDDSPQQLQRYAVGTVKWAVDHLKREFFAADPDEILDIYLFKDAASYNRYTRELFHARPHTPFGYYSPRDRALIMNIATGGGTLVHEIVHPFMRANFPQCPAWFNEGLGSLYEQSAERDGHIVGLTNWRLAGLQKAIQAGNVPSFASLLETDDDAFYGHDPGTNYAQARYLCYYLQENGLLVKFYRQFLASHEGDPTGLHTLRAVLGRDDLASFKDEWEKYVMKLTFP